MCSPTAPWRPRVGNRLAHTIAGECRLAAHIHDHPVGADRVGAEQRAFEELMRIALEQLPIFERPGFGLVAVHDDVGGPLRRQQVPLLRGGERAPATPPREPGGSDLGEHAGRRHVGDRPPEGG